MLLDGIGGELLHPGRDLDQAIGSIAVGAMEPEHMLQRVEPGTLVIVPGDREDVIRAIATAHLMGPPRGGTAEAMLLASRGTDAGAGPRGPPRRGGLGLVLTGGYRPRPGTIDAIRSADLFAVLVPDDTYVVASGIHDLLVKTNPSDRDKIEEIKALLWEHLVIDRVLEVAATDEG